MTTWDWYIIGILFMALVCAVIVIRAIFRGTPDHTRKRKPYYYRMGRKSDRGF